MPRTDSAEHDRRLTLADIEDLPVMLDVPTAGRLLGISRATAYRLAATDDLPVPVVPVGRSLRVPAAPLLALLGVTPAPATDAVTAAERGTEASGTGGAAAPADTAPDGRGAGADQDARPAPLPDPGPTSGDGQTPTR